VLGGESSVALAAGLQDELRALDRVPREYRERQPLFGFNLTSEVEDVDRRGMLTP
jgi:hypothetical protein